VSLAGRTILVTGADGFIGSHLAERLVRLGARVRAVTLYNSFGSRGWLDSVSDDVTAAMDIRAGDVRDSGFVDAAADGAEIVMHLAALIAIPYSYVAPRSVVETNVTGTLNVLEAVRHHHAARLIHTSTSEVYGTPETLPIRETHPVQGQSPYSASKIAADQLCEAYWRSFDVPAIVLRPFNTYGPRQSMRAVLPTIVAQLLAGQERVQLGDVRPRRDLTYVADTVDGFIRAATAAGIEGEVIQLGTGLTVSVAELFDLTQRVLGTSAKLERDDQRVRPERSEVMVLQCDPAKAEQKLGWRPTVSLEEGIRRTAEWCSAHLTLTRARQYHV
jgi:NAD dependent epimerase/dehydratase